MRETGCYFGLINITIQNKWFHESFIFKLSYFTCHCQHIFLSHGNLSLLTYILVSLYYVIANIYPWVMIFCHYPYIFLWTKGYVPSFWAKYNIKFNKLLNISSKFPVLNRNNFNSSLSDCFNSLENFSLDIKYKNSTS